MLNLQTNRIEEPRNRSPSRTHLLTTPLKNQIIVKPKLIEEPLAPNLSLLLRFLAIRYCQTIFPISKSRINTNPRQNLLPEFQTSSNQIIVTPKLTEEPPKALNNLSLVRPTNLVPSAKLDSLLKSVP